MQRYNQSLLIISHVTRCAATWPLVLELIFFLSNNVRMSKATEMCPRDHNSNNCTHSGNVCYCMYMVNNDYAKLRSFSRLYMTISASNLHIFAWWSRQIFSFSLQWPGGSTQWLGSLSIGRPTVRKSFTDFYFVVSADTILCKLDTATCKLDTRLVFDNVNE